MPELTELQARMLERLRDHASQARAHFGFTSDYLVLERAEGSYFGLFARRETPSEADSRLAKRLLQELEARGSSLEYLKGAMLYDTNLFVHFEDPDADAMAGFLACHTVHPPAVDVVCERELLTQLAPGARPRVVKDYVVLPVANHTVRFYDLESALR